ncbi:pyrimidodiazepine synthase-like [Schistocerca nitens]|uniref:pyrimidodiazepine synthase-like n=1 Tax=Schistocerca nitens TaxID=7011 RepID=UPI0021198970|nr:pyrimidodiazepine synthase-like [Schistocerca nitens]
MSTKHLKKGDAQPAPPEGEKLRLYSMAFCPYSHRARLALAAKGVPFDIVNINLLDKPDWLTSVQPQGKVPALDAGGGQIVIESLDIADFLDGKFPEPPLWPADADTKARHKKLIDDFGKVTKIFYEAVYGKEKRPLGDYLEEIVAALQPFEDELVAGGNTFFGGTRPSMLDYMIWPWAERAKVPSIINKQEMNFPKDKFPKLLAWRDAMKEEAAVKAQAVDTERHARFSSAYVDGTLDYDSV